MFGVKTTSEVSLTLSAADVLLCRNSGAALEGPQAPCEHVSLCPIQAAPLSYHPLQMVCSSRILPVKGPRYTLCMSQTPNHPKLSCCLSYRMQPASPGITPALVSFLSICSGIYFVTVIWSMSIYFTRIFMSQVPIIFSHDIFICRNTFSNNP